MPVNTVSFDLEFVHFIEDKTLALVPTLCQVGTNASPIKQKITVNTVVCNSTQAPAQLKGPQTDTVFY